MLTSNGASSHQNEGRSTLDFTVPSTGRHLPSLSTYTKNLDNIDQWLGSYLSTVEQEQSLAVNRGEMASGSYLAQQLRRLFTTAEPDMVRGPPIDWMQVVLSQDPLSQNTEDDMYTLGESVMRIPRLDMDLLSSGRPRQFLTPWPPTSDIQKELAILDVVADELGGLMKALSSLSYKGIQLQNCLENRKNSLRQDTGSYRIPPPSHTPRSHSSLPADVMTANRSHRGFDEVLIPESPERRRLSHVSCGADAGHDRATAIPSDAIGPSVQGTQSVQKGAMEIIASKDAETISQVCDYCRRNNKACRLKLSGTCYNCAERKKKCKFSGNAMSTRNDHVTGPVDAVVTQLDIPAPSGTSTFGGAQHRPRSNPGSLSGHVTGPHESAPVFSHSRVLPLARGSPTDTRDPYVSVAASTAEDDVELPPSRTIRSSSLVKRWAGDVHDDERIKRLRIAHSR